MDDPSEHLWRDGANTLVDGNDAGGVHEVVLTVWDGLVLGLVNCSPVPRRRSTLPKSRTC